MLMLAYLAYRFCIFHVQIPNKCKTLEGVTASSPIVELVAADKLLGPALSICLRESGKITIKSNDNYEENRSCSTAADPSRGRKAGASPKPCCSRSLETSFDEAPYSPPCNIKSEILTLADETLAGEQPPSPKQNDAPNNSLPDLNMQKAQTPMPSNPVKAAIESNNLESAHPACSSVSTNILKQALLDHDNNHVVESAITSTHLDLRVSCPDSSRGLCSDEQSVMPVTDDLCGDVSLKRNGDRQTSDEVGDRSSSTSSATQHWFSANCC